MDISATAPAALAPIRPVSPVAPTATSGSAGALATLQGLASVVLDATGQYSQTDKLDAYNQSFRLSVTGQYRGVGQDGADLLNQMANSGTSQAIEAQRVDYAAKMSAAIQRAGATGVPRAQALGAAALAHFDGLSDGDQKILFASINAPDRTAVTPFAGIDDWRGQMAAMGRVSTPVDRVSLSDAAKALIGPPAPPAAPRSAAYVTGSVANVRV